MTQSISRFRKIGSGNGSDENSNRCNAVISRLTALNVYGVLRQKPQLVENTEVAVFSIVLQQRKTTKSPHLIFKRFLKNQVG